MNQLTARPKLLKQANLTLIRKVIKAKGTATRAEIAMETKISSTTVRSLLNEMIQNKEIESIGYDESSGGRKAERYSLLPNRYHCAAFCISEGIVHALLVNICGEILETARLDVKNDNYEGVIFPFLDSLIKKREIKAIGLGVPGIVDGTNYWKQQPENGEFNKLTIGTSLSRRYKVPVVLENDLNATTIGFAQCYAKEFPGMNEETTNIAYLHFAEGCISAGFIAGGNVIRGFRNYAGELGLIPVENDIPLDTILTKSVSNEEYIRTITQTIVWICGILNPEYVVLSGPDLREDCVSSIDSLLFSLLPKQMTAQILYSNDVWNDYYNGLAYLTAGKMFHDVQLIGEQVYEK